MRLTKDFIEVYALVLGFNKKEIPNIIKRDKNYIHFLKGFFETEGTQHHSHLIIYQNNKRILQDFLEIANRFNLSAHIHRNSKKRKKEYWLVSDSKILNFPYGDQT